MSHRSIRFRVLTLTLPPAPLLLGAALLHITITTAIFAAGHFHIFTPTFDDYGNVVAIAQDTVDHREQAVMLREMLARGDAGAWLREPRSLALKIYSICFALFGRVLGENILGAEPFNAFCYVAILAVVFNLAGDATTRSAGLIAVGLVALWPSFLLHTTQLLKDPYFILAMLVFVWITQMWLTTVLSWFDALLLAGAGGLTAATIWLTRDNAASALLGTLVVGVVMFLVRQISLRRIVKTNLVGMVLMILLVLAAAALLPDYSRRTGSQTRAAFEPVKQQMAQTTVGKLAAFIALRRLRFLRSYPDAGSNIDSDVQFNTTGDVIRYFPRSVEIGWLAPFPNKWSSSGRLLSRFGRFLVGIEMIATYLCEALALYGLWQLRRSPCVWLLFLIAALGMIGLGYIVVNAGALYRIRYLFLILLLPLTGAGAVQLTNRLAGGRPNNPAPYLELGLYFQFPHFR